MFELWVPITIGSSIAQNLRSSIQKHLKGTLSTAGATSVRFLFAVPIVAVYVTILCTTFGYTIPTPGSTFYLYASLGSLGQILGTAFLIHSFSFRNFVVGTAFSKTETVQAAVFGILVLADPITSWALVGILVSLVGVMQLAVAAQGAGVRELIGSFFQKEAGYGMACGTCYGIASVCYRAASLSLQTDFMISAATTLGYVLVLQSLIMFVYLVLREPGQLTAILGAWKLSSLVGLSGMTASAGWLTAMTSQNAAHVRALGQVELCFTFLSPVLFCRERVKPAELIGATLIVVGLVALLIKA